ncbi:hypothetical protein V6N13_064379 [Hibiscus sabdariffa]|uniref:Uncharacterized protein n=1 Tax=Hibiscus sabdariffa TaxID=183260 RepID=A0ABR2EDF6_9ROSI
MNFYNIVVVNDEHCAFGDDIYDEKIDLMVRNLCAKGAQWTRLRPSTHNTTVNLERMCFIHSIMKRCKIYVCTIIDQEIVDCVTRSNGILAFPYLIMQLYQIKIIVPLEEEEVLDNKSPVNEASIERMTHGKDTPTIKEATTSKAHKGKAKAEHEGTTPTIGRELWMEITDVEKQSNTLNNGQIKLVAKIDDMDKA